MGFWKRLFGTPAVPHQFENSNEPTTLSCPTCGRDYRVGLDSIIISVDSAISSMKSAIIFSDGAQPERVDDVYFLSECSPDHTLEDARESAELVREAIASGAKRSWICAKCQNKKSPHPYPVSFLEPYSEPKQGKSETPPSKTAESKDDDNENVADRYAGTFNISERVIYDDENRFRGFFFPEERLNDDTKMKMKVTVIAAGRDGLYSEEMKSVLFLYVSVGDYKVIQDDAGDSLLFPVDIYESEQIKKAKGESDG